MRCRKKVSDALSVRNRNVLRATDRPRDYVHSIVVRAATHRPSRYRSEIYDTAAWRSRPLLDARQLAQFAADHGLLRGLGARSAPTAA
jgi:hypothetical protein